MLKNIPSVNRQRSVGYRYPGNTLTPVINMDYLTTILQDQPAAILRLNDVGGNTTTWLDVSGFQRTYTQTGILMAQQPSIVNNDPGGLSVLFLGGTNPNVAALLNTTPNRVPMSLTRTHELWLNLGGVAAPSNRRFYQEGNTFAQVLSATQQIQWVLKDVNGALNILTGVTALSASQTYHLSLVADGTNMSIYLNGVLDSQQLCPAAFVGAAAGQLGVQISNNGLHCFNQNYAIYTYALNTTQILSHYNKGK